MTSAKSVSVERFVAAPAPQIFDLLADPAQHVALDGSGSVKGLRRGPDRLTLGAKFAMTMRQRVPYGVTNEVVEFEEGRRIAWQHFAHDVWRYELEAAEGGTLVRETFDWSHGRGGRILELMHVPEKNRTAMERTLERLAAAVETAN